MMIHRIFCLLGFMILSSATLSHEHSIWGIYYIPITLDQYHSIEIYQSKIKEMPFLEELEMRSELVQFIKSRMCGPFDNEWSYYKGADCWKYFRVLYGYNKALEDQIMDTEHNIDIVYYEKCLINVIEIIKEEAQLNTLDIEQEIRMTRDLIIRTINK